ncbi:hypothetical protein HS088_TW11G01080 [Tripterygium wilfordii]|uniref:Uncharacterized protein n=1 Tax=Tripterygium wilfordii TaxID=458696 RepID=A0A7J7D401_TRIWF|nr:hypothetical protein HS088_TW11G01080 [Tripterygium wilfordii]
MLYQNSILVSTLQSSAELRKEIAALEVEILDLESYLLSLYRTRGVYEGKNNLVRAQEYLVYGTRSRVKSGSVLKVKDVFNAVIEAVIMTLCSLTEVLLFSKLIFQAAYNVRVYRAKNIFQDLKLAKEEYIEANMYVHKEKKILLPRILYYFALERPWTCLDRPIR